MKKLLNFFIYSNVLISGAALYIFIGTCSIFKIAVEKELYYFIFFATLASYSLHWYLTNEHHGERNQWNQAHKKTIGALFIIAICNAIFLLSTHLYWAPAIAPIVFMTLLYTAPKFPHFFFQKLQGKALAKTFYLSFVWVYTTCYLPFLISKTAINNEGLFYILTKFDFFYIICLIFDYKDRHNDKLPFLLFDTNKHINKIVHLLMVLPMILLIVLPYSALIHRLAIIFILSYWVILYTLPTSLTTNKDKWFYLFLDSWMAAPFLIHQIIRYIYPI